MTRLLVFLAVGSVGLHEVFWPQRKLGTCRKLETFSSVLRILDLSCLLHDFSYEDLSYTSNQSRDLWRWGLCS